MENAWNFEIIPAVAGKVFRLGCPTCGERVKGVGLRAEASPVGLSFKCKRCGRLWEIKQKSEGALRPPLM